MSILQIYNFENQQHLKKIHSYIISFPINNSFHLNLSAKPLPLNVDGTLIPIVRVKPTKQNPDIGK